MHGNTFVGSKQTLFLICLRFHWAQAFKGEFLHELIISLSISTFFLLERFRRPERHRCRVVRDKRIVYS